MLLEKFDTKETETLPTSAVDEIVIVNPAAELQNISFSIATRLSSLRGARVGIVDNAKHMALPLLKALESILSTEYGVASFNYYRKENASIPMPKEEMDAMAKASDAVVHGVADCGSCITWGLHDSVAFEKLGVPAVNVITTGFSVAAKARARTLGMQEHPLVAVQHPLANRTTNEVENFARQIAYQVVSGLVKDR
jgi:hypothetical protein